MARGKLRWWKRLPPLTGFGIKVLVIANDVVTTEDAKHVQRTLKASCSRSESSAWRLARVRTRPYGKIPA